MVVRMVYINISTTFLYFYYNIGNHKNNRCYMIYRLNIDQSVNKEYDSPVEKKRMIKWNVMNKKE